MNSFGAAGVITTGSPTPAITESGALPAGLTFVDNGNGTALISGTPTATGTSTLTVTAANGISPNATQTYTIFVGQTPGFTSPATATFVAGTDSSFGVTTSGYPAPSIGATGLPAGLTLTDKGDGTATISGSADPAGAGVHTVTLTAANATATVTQSVDITVQVKPAFTSVATATLPAGSPGSFAVTTIGSPTAAISQTGLPASLSFNDNGDGTASITGTPTVADAGPHTVVLTATSPIGSASSDADADRLDHRGTGHHQCGHRQLHRRSSRAASR